MQNKLLKLYNECIDELKSIGIDMTDANIGQIFIRITNRSKKGMVYVNKKNQIENTFIKKEKVEEF